VTDILAGHGHLAALREALADFDDAAERADRWGRRLAELLPAGARLLACGNGGSAAQAQHLTAELVGRYCDDRPAFSAIPLHADTSAITALANDYGADEIFRRQVAAHGRPGDVLVALSTSGGSRNVLLAAAEGRRRGLLTWAVTGPAPNPLAEACGEAVCVPARDTCTVQELHLVVVHLICAAFDIALGVSTAGPDGAPLAAVADLPVGRPEPAEPAEPAPAARRSGAAGGGQ
jgi:D-sedoheptulose 7-phosphate isomerase